jgi:hypothetical protein
MTLFDIEKVGNTFIVWHPRCRSYGKFGIITKEHNDNCWMFVPSPDFRWPAEAMDAISYFMKTLEN